MTFNALENNLEKHLCHQEWRKTAQSMFKFKAMLIEPYIVKENKLLNYMRFDENILKLNFKMFLFLKFKI